MAPKGVSVGVGVKVGVEVGVLVGVRVGVRVGVGVLVRVVVAVLVGVGDLKSRACSVCCAARVWAASVKAAPGGGDVVPAAGGLDTAGRHAAMTRANTPMANHLIPIFRLIELLLVAIGNAVQFLSILKAICLSIYHFYTCLQVIHFRVSEIKYPA